MRIDAVGYTQAGIYIIEITRRAGLKAIGQLESYPLLFKDKFNPRAKVIPYLVCEELKSDWTELEAEAGKVLKRFFKKQTGKRPVIIPVIVEI